MTYQVPNKDCKINLDNVTYIKIRFVEDTLYSLDHKKGEKKHRLLFTEPKYYEENEYRSVFGYTYKESELKDEHIFIDGKIYELPRVEVYFLNSNKINIVCKTFEEAQQLYNDIDEKLNQYKKDEAKDIDGIA